MNVVRWDPFADVDNLFNRMLPRMQAGWPRLSGRNGDEIEWSPSADISETDREYFIRTELPAVKKEDVKVTVEDHLLTVQGERKQHKEDRTEKFHRVESFHGTFLRRFALPDNVDEKGIKCEDKDGILTIRLPKAATAKAQRPIEITVQ